MLAEGISGCEQLAFSVRRGPLEVDLAFPYHPHVTVAHHLADAQLDRAFDELASFECSFTPTGSRSTSTTARTAGRRPGDFVLTAAADG